MLVDLCSYNYTNFEPQIPQYPATIADEELPETNNLAPTTLSTATDHMCMWKKKPNSNCGLSFENEAALQQHLLENHIKQLGKDRCGYMCQWEGCSRQEKNREKAGFGQRSKIERHMYTHTGCKFHFV